MHFSHFLTISARREPSKRFVDKWVKNKSTFRKIVLKFKKKKNICENNYAKYKLKPKTLIYSSVRE